MSPRSNSVSAARKARRNKHEWTHFDYLPAKLRRALHEASVDWHPSHARLDFVRLLAQGFDHDTAVDRTIALYEAADRDELRRFKYRWSPSRFGPYPAVAARSTFQRYDRAATARCCITEAAD